MLVVNTAFMKANLALETPKGTVVLKDIDAKSKHSENVLKTIDEMCQEAEIDILDVETMAVVVGPGSFTGLRIGTAIAKALACVNAKLKLVALSSLELMAYIIAKNKLCKGNFVCVLNALSDLFFVAYFDKSGIKIQEEKMIDKQTFSTIDFPIFALKDDFQDNLFSEIEISCQDVLDFAKLKRDQENFVDIEQMVPLYLRASQAEDNLRHKTEKFNKNS